MPARYKRSPKEDRTWNSRLYDSKNEMNWAIKLHTLNDAGKIKELREQVKFVLVPKDAENRAICYVADFVFIESGKEVVMDAKGHKTQLYTLKKRLMKFLHGIEIEEV